jgi:hypothetical protein
MTKWLPLENGIIKLMIELKRDPDGEYEQEFYYTQEGNQKYHDYNWNHPEIFFGKLVEFYDNGEVISRCSFCNGR